MGLGWGVAAALRSLVFLKEGCGDDTRYAIPLTPCPSQPRALQSQIKQDHPHLFTALQWSRICGVVIGVTLWTLLYRLRTRLWKSEPMRLEQDFCGLFPIPFTTRKFVRSSASRLPTSPAVHEKADSPTGIGIPETQLSGPSCGAGSRFLTKSTHPVGGTLVADDTYDLDSAIPPIETTNNYGHALTSARIGSIAGMRSVSSDGRLSWSHQIPRESDWPVTLEPGTEDAPMAPEGAASLPALKTIRVCDSTDTRAPIRRGRGCKHGLWKPDHPVNTFRPTQAGCGPSEPRAVRQ